MTVAGLFEIIAEADGLRALAAGRRLQPRQPHTGTCSPLEAAAVLYSAILRDVHLFVLDSGTDRGDFY